MKEIVLQKIMFNQDGCGITDDTREMYYRGDGVIVFDSQENGWNILSGRFFDFFTYFNSLSIEKWKKYTYVKKVSFHLTAKGRFRLVLMGHYVNKNGCIKKEWLGHYNLNFDEKEEVVIDIPEGIDSSVISFQITAFDNVFIYDASYNAEIEKENDVFITLATTTFRKESYICKNINILNSTIFVDEELKDHFSWKIIDNGRTLNPDEFNNEHIEVVSNKNVGGSGGFCKGMIEALNQNKKPTHILLMDDDVRFIPESFRRVYMLLSLIRPNYKDYFISGAMLEINQQNIQHEDVGVFRLNGEHGPSKPRFNLNLWDSVVLNEKLLDEDEHQYSGWWYCCIPTSIADYNNLPLPFFIRGDDVEYSIRNHAKFITMNGICIWHEGFGLKFSGAMEFYQVHRNDLILQTMNKNIEDVKVLERIDNLFWEEIFKFNYKGATLLLDSVEDFLKGPEFIKSLNGEQCMKEKKAADNSLKPITDEIRCKIDYNHLYDGGPLTGISLKLYGHFVNGQLLPSILAGKKETVIPYGWGYSQKKLNKAKIVYAVDPVNDLYVKYTRDNNKFRQLKKRYLVLKDRIEKEYEKVASAYRNAEKEMESVDFWECYLA